MKRLWCLVFVVFAGCQSPVESQNKAVAVGWLKKQGMSDAEATILVNDKPALRRYVLDKTMAGQDDKYCRSFGASPGSTAYVNCRTTLSANRPANDPPQVVTRNVYVANDGPKAPEIAPWPQQQPQVVYQPAPGSTLMNAGRSAYCTRTPWNC